MGNLTAAVLKPNRLIEPLDAEEIYDIIPVRNRGDKLLLALRTFRQKLRLLPDTGLAIRAIIIPVSVKRKHKGA